MDKPMARWALAVLVGAVSVSAVLAGTAARTTDQPDDWSELRTGQQVFRAACATCHGGDGTGGAAVTEGLPITPPDFNDCEFATREPRADWFAIAHDGGPVRGFDRLMPGFGGALSDDQLELAVGHLKSFCPERSWPQGEFNLPRALKTGKAFPEDEILWQLESTVEEPVALEGKFVIEKRIGARNQIEVAVPGGVQQIEYLRADGSAEYRWGGGVGDISLGWKGVLWHALEAGTIGSTGLEVFFPVGDEKDGFSSGIFKLEPFLAIGQLIPGNNFLQLHAGAELSTDTDVAGHELFWRAAVGHTFTQGRFGRAWSPMVEVLGGMELGDEAAPEWSVVPGLQITLSARQHVFLALGAEIPITDFADRQTAVIAYVLWDWFDGGFFEGW